jgi:hypothetical protein
MQYRNYDKKFFCYHILQKKTKTHSSSSYHKEVIEHFFSYFLKIIKKYFN